MDCRKWSPLITLVIGALSLLIGVVILGSMSAIVSGTVKKILPLRQNSKGELNEVTKTWVRPPYNIRMEFFVFNVTNAREIVNHGAKPALIQHGPYVYKEIQEKFALNFTTDGLYVYYNNNKTYYFDHSESCDVCTEEDVFTVPNLIPLLIAQNAQNDPLFSTKERQELLGVLLGTLGELPFTTQKLNELIYEGYNDILLKLAPYIPGAANLTGGFLPEKMAYLYGKNHTDDGRYKVGTGAENVEELGNIFEWNYSDLVPERCWNDSYGNFSFMVNGTDGSLYKPFLTRDSTLYIFVSDICRSVTATFHSDVIYQDIPAYLYTIPPELLQYSRPENRGFCIDTPISRRTYVQNQTEGCLDDGLLDVSRCLEPLGSPPIVISWPHFLFSTPNTINAVDGMSPNWEDHVTQIIVEPTTGVGLKMQRKVQLNVALNNYPFIPPYQAMQNLIIPVFWYNESAYIDSETRARVYNAVVVGKRAGYSMGFVLLAVGSACVMGVLLYFLLYGTRKSEETPTNIVNPGYSSKNTSVLPSAIPSTAVTPEIMRRSRRDHGLLQSTPNPVNTSEEVPNGAPLVEVDLNEVEVHHSSSSSSFEIEHAQPAEEENEHSESEEEEIQPCVEPEKQEDEHAPSQGMDDMMHAQSEEKEDDQAQPEETDNDLQKDGSRDSSFEISEEEKDVSVSHNSEESKPTAEEAESML